MNLLKFPSSGRELQRREEKFLFAEFKQCGRSHAAADANGLYPVSDFFPLHAGQQCGAQFYASAAQGVPEGDGAAVDVDFVHAKTDLPDAAILGKRGTAEILPIF